MQNIATMLINRSSEWRKSQDMVTDLYEIIRAIGGIESKVINDRVLSVMLEEQKASLERNDIKYTELLYKQYRKHLFHTAPYVFDHYLKAMEYDAIETRRFYKYRRHFLAPMVSAYQEVYDGELDVLTISQPKRTGKSQTGLLFATMLSGRLPNNSILMEGAGDGLVKSFYKGFLEYVVKGSEYNFHEIFPAAQLISTNADDKTINLNMNSRFPTIMCRSLDAGQVGLSEATNALMLDDCVKGRTEGRNRALLDKNWEIISGDVMGRALEGTPIIATGTRYSIHDPIGRIQEHAIQSGLRWKKIEIPALDSVEESNYQHYNPQVKKHIFSAAWLKEQRELLNEEQFESEFQQQPIEARGKLFEDLKYFFELPVDSDPDTIIAACDTAERGTDSVAMPVAAVYGADVYIIDVVHDNREPEFTKPKCARALVNNKVNGAIFESNGAGEYYAKDVNNLVSSMEWKVNIRTKRTISNKATRIDMASDNIKKNFYFKHPSTYDKNSDYASFMKEVLSYLRTGKVPHDDAPDSLSLLENELRNLGSGKIEVLDRKNYGF